MNTPRTTSEPEQTPVAPRRSRLWLWRGLMLSGLLIALWVYVLPYQAGVRLDKSLSSWVSEHPGWTLEREERSLYQRYYRLSWQPDWATEPVRLNVRVFSRPFGWSSPAGRQWGWATFTVRMDPSSPIQIRHWPDRTMVVTGQVEALGRIRFNWMGNTVSQLVYERSRRAWWGMLNLAGWQLNTPQQHFLFGRSLIDIDLHQRRGADALDGELGIDIRRIGWSSQGRASASTTGAIDLPTRGLVDHVQWRLRIMPDLSGRQRDVIGSCSLEALQVNDRPLGGGQLAFALYAADPELMDRLGALVQPLRAGRARFPDRRSVLSVLAALRSAEIRLDALRWQTPSGNMRFSAKAFGPAFIGIDAQPEGLTPSRAWQAQAELQLSGTILRSPIIMPLIDWLNSWLPAPITAPRSTRGPPVRYILAYSPGGWVLDRTEAERPSANPATSP